MLARHHRIDAVVASAGWGVAGAVEHTTIDEAKAQVETNLWGATRLVQQVLPAMRAQGGGRIVLISSIGGIVAIPFQAYYSVSKFALEGFGEALAYEVAPFGIEVTLVEPGNVRTDFTANRKMAASSGGDEVYRRALDTAVCTMERDEANGVPADDVAAVVERVLDCETPTAAGLGGQGRGEDRHRRQTAASPARLRGGRQGQSGCEVGGTSTAGGLSAFEQGVDVPVGGVGRGGEVGQTETVLDRSQDAGAVDGCSIVQRPRFERGGHHDRRDVPPAPPLIPDVSLSRASSHSMMI